jgi:phage gpG-like protein
VADIALRLKVGDAVETVLAVETALADPSELMADILLVMLRSTQLTFQESGRPDRWTPLAQSTIDQRLRSNSKGRAIVRNANKKLSGKAAVKAQNAYFAASGNVQILRDTGALLLSLGGSASGAFQTEDGFGESDQFTAELGTNHPGAEALQFVIAGGRPFLLIQTVDEEDIMDMSVQFVLQEGPYAK